MAASDLAQPLITLDELEHLQVEFARHQNALGGVRDKHALEISLTRHLFKVGEVLVYDSPPRRAAVLANELVTRRPFKSCNRRTAVEAIIIWMDREKWYMLCTPAELAESLDQLAEGKLPEQQFYLWLARNSRPKPTSHPGGDPGMRRVGSRANWDPTKESFPPKSLVGPELGR
ncbi:MAG: hypothetical protein ACREP9_02905 [Candidatus Dormibacteraceae bacterium]